ncbi:MAG: hypothetical protein Q8R28_06675 [Dehalococcoidia bacterium]|nr:hypothetical protein [Dehalococcoidia bacterium]
MRTGRLLSVMTAALVFAVLTWSPAPVAADQADNGGVINGTLVNRTPGGAGVGDASINLVTYQGETQVAQVSTKSDSLGHFQFGGLATSAGYYYGLSVLYQGAKYVVDFRQFDPGNTALDWEVPVYDPTPDVSNIHISRGHLIVDVQAGELSVLQFFDFVNSGDKTYVGVHPITSDGSKETLRLSLPQEADQITAQEGLDECCAFRTDDGISDTLAVPPGNRSVVFSYALPYSSSNLSLDLPLYYKVDTFDLLVSDQKAQVSTKQLQRQDPVDMGGQKYQHFTAANLSGDTELLVDLTGLGGKNSVSSFVNPANLRWGGIGAAVIGIGIVLFFGLRRREPVVAPAVAGGSQRPVRRDVLARELAELDDKFAAGQISEDRYEKLKEEKEMRLAELNSGDVGNPKDGLS